jgi:hypothetical protein
MGSTTSTPERRASVSPHMAQTYSSNAALKGGVGSFVAQGLAAGGLTRYPRRQALDVTQTSAQFQQAFNKCHANSFRQHIFSESKFPLDPSDFDCSGFQTRKAPSFNPFVRRALHHVPSSLPIGFLFKALIPFIHLCSSQNTVSLAALSMEQQKTSVSDTPINVPQRSHNMIGSRAHTCRSARHGDLDFASKWTAMSFYENDGRRVRHHLETLDCLEAARIKANEDEALAREGDLNQVPLCC